MLGISYNPQDVARLEQQVSGGGQIIVLAALDSDEQGTIVFAQVGVLEFLAHDRRLLRDGKVDELDFLISGVGMYALGLDERQ